MMDQRPSRRFSHSDAFEFIWLSEGADMRVENIRVAQDLLDTLDSIENLDQPGIVLMKGTRYDARLQPAELDQFLIGPWRPAAVDDVQPGKRPDPVDTIGITCRLKVGRL